MIQNLLQNVVKLYTNYFGCIIFRNLNVSSDIYAFDYYGQQKVQISENNTIKIYNTTFTQQPNEDELDVYYYDKKLTSPALIDKKYGYELILLDFRQSQNGNQELIIKQLQELINNHLMQNQL